MGFFVVIVTWAGVHYYSRRSDGSRSGGQASQNFHMTPAQGDSRGPWTIATPPAETSSHVRSVGGASSAANNNTDTPKDVSSTAGTLGKTREVDKYRGGPPSDTWSTTATLG